MVFSLLSFRPRPLARPACASRPHVPSPPWPQFALRGAGECGTKGRGRTALSLWFQNRRRLRHAGTCVEGRAEGERSSEMVAIPAGPCEAPNTWALHLRGPDSAKARKHARSSQPPRAMLLKEGEAWRISGSLQFGFASSHFSCAQTEPGPPFAMQACAAVSGGGPAESVSSLSVFRLLA